MNTAKVSTPAHHRAPESRGFSTSAPSSPVSRPTRSARASSQREAPIQAAPMRASISPGAAIGSPGVVSGDTIQVPVHLPISMFDADGNLKLTRADGSVMILNSDGTLTPES